MASIIFTDNTGHYDGTYLDSRPLGGTETSVIRCARELARRGNNVTVFSNCDAPIEHEGVSWRPLSGPRPQTCEVYVAIQHPKLLGFIRKPKRRAIWVLWPSSQLKHYKKIGLMWIYRPLPILMSQYQVHTYSPFLPRRKNHTIIPLAVPDDVRGRGVRNSVPPPKAIFASNPQRNLRRLVEIWAESILPRVPNATLDVYGVHNLGPNDDPWKAWEGTLLPAGLPTGVKASVRVHSTASRADLLAAMRDSRVMLYLGHKCEAFCLSLAEAQALGVPAVVAPIAVLPERVIDGVTGYVHADPAEFAKAAVSLLTDEVLWRRQNEAAIARQQGVSWPEYAESFESALLGNHA